MIWRLIEHLGVSLAALYVVFATIFAVRLLTKGPETEIDLGLVLWLLCFAGFSAVLAVVAALAAEPRTPA